MHYLKSYVYVYIYVYTYLYIFIFIYILYYLIYPHHPMKRYNYFHFTDQKNEAYRLNNLPKNQSESRALNIALCKLETLLGTFYGLVFRRPLPGTGNGGFRCLCVSTQSLSYPLLPVSKSVSDP